MADPVRIAPRTNTLPQPIEDRRNEPARMRDRRRVTNHLTIEKCAPGFHQAEADQTDFGTVPDESGKPSQLPDELLNPLTAETFKTAASQHKLSL